MIGVLSRVVDSGPPDKIMPFAVRAKSSAAKLSQEKVQNRTLH